MGWCAGACDSAQRPQQGDGDRAAAGMVQAIVMAVGGVPGVEGMGGEGAECHGGVAGALHAVEGLERMDQDTRRGSAAQVSKLTYCETQAAVVVAPTALTLARLRA